MYLKFQKKEGGEKRTTDYKKKVWELIMDGGQKWAAVGAVSLQAHDSISDAKETVDSVMYELPANASQQELHNFITSMGPRLEMKKKELKKQLGLIETI